MWQYEHVRSPLAHQHLQDTRSTESQVSILHLFKRYNHMVAYILRQLLYTLQNVYLQRGKQVEKGERRGEKGVCGQGLDLHPIATKLPLLFFFCCNSSKFSCLIDYLYHFCSLFRQSASMTIICVFQCRVADDNKRPFILLLVGEWLL